MGKRKQEREKLRNALIKWAEGANMWVFSDQVQPVTWEDEIKLFFESYDPTSPA